MTTHRWMPLSPCGDGCLPGPGTVRATNPLVVLARLLGAIAVLVCGAVVIGAVVLVAAALRTRGAVSRAPYRRRDVLVRRWFRLLIRAFGVRLVLHGGPVAAGPGVLVVADHTSWFDVLALGAVGPVRMVGKSEVRDWPLLGPIAVLMGTVFVRRESLRALPSVVAEVAAALRAGDSIAVFPEGTTRCGRITGRFRPALFQAAVDAHAAVRPVGVRYLLDGSVCTAPAFVGGATLLGSVLRVAMVSGLVVEVTVHPLLGAGNGHRRNLADAAFAAVRNGLYPLCPTSQPDIPVQHSRLTVLSPDVQPNQQGWLDELNEALVEPP